MPSPIVIFAFILATLCGALFHLIFGGDARRLALYLLAGWIGFAAGQLVGSNMSITILSIGGLHTFACIMGAFLALLVTRFIARRAVRAT